MHLTVRGEVEGLDEAAFRQAAEPPRTAAPSRTPSAGVEITLDASLA
jgi:osmotically inducible protein OsmC